MNKADKKAEILALFDGECMMCNSFIRMLDRAGRGASTTIEVTPNCQKFLNLAGGEIDAEIIESEITQTIIVYELGGSKEVLIKSRAIARLIYATESRRLRALSLVIKLTPRWIADLAYDMVSRNRKKIPISTCNVNKLEWIVVHE